MISNEADYQEAVKRLGQVSLGIVDGHANRKPRRSLGRVCHAFGSGLYAAGLRRSDLPQLRRPSALCAFARRLSHDRRWYPYRAATANLNATSSDDPSPPTLSTENSNGQRLLGRGKGQPQQRP